MKRNFDLIIFDLDGTLYPANKDMDMGYPGAAIQLLARKTGRDLAEVEQEFLNRKEDLHSLINGKPTSTLTLLYYYDVSFDEFENEVDQVLNIDHYIQPDPKCVRVVQRIHTEYPLFLYTTNNAKVSRRILKRLGLDTLFPEERRFTYTDAGKLDLPRREKLEYIKPGKKGFKHILNKQNAEPERTLMIGDSEVSDILPARKLGLQIYHITDRNSFYSLPEWLGI
jgi:FMN phosphatase YigB (HAD superfamily)